MKVGQVVIGGFIYNVNVDFKEADGITSKDCKLSDEEKKDLTAKVNTFAQEYMSALRNSTPQGDPLSKYELIQINEDGATYGGKSFRWDHAVEGSHQGLAAKAFEATRAAWGKVFDKLKELSTRSEASSAATAIALTVAPGSTSSDISESIKREATAIAATITTTTTPDWTSLPADKLYELVLEKTAETYRRTETEGSYTKGDWENLSNLRAAVLNKLAEKKDVTFKTELRTAVKAWIKEHAIGSPAKWKNRDESYKIIQAAFNNHAQAIFDRANPLSETLAQLISSS